MKMDVTDVVAKGEEPKKYETFTVNGVNYRYSPKDKGLLLEKNVGTAPWTEVGVAENQLAIDKYKQFLNPNIPGMTEDMRNKLLSAIVSQDSVNDMLKKNRKRSSPLLDGLMKRM